MAFPSTSTATATLFASSVSTFPVNMPASIASGDLLIAIVTARNFGTGVWTTVPSGWTQIFSIQMNATGIYTAWYKIANGTESGTTPSWIFNTTNTAAWHVRRITSWHGTTPPEATTFSSTGTIGASLANPPSLTPSWGSADTLWIASMADTAQAVSITAAPTSYTDFVVSTGSTGGSTAQVATSYRQLTASSEDPSAFTTGSDRWYAAATIAVRPAAGGGGGVTNTTAFFAVLMV